ncbi:MAG: EamA family transporter [bacterium]|nr:EamA family transporter [bacterium]
MGFLAGIITAVALSFQNTSFRKLQDIDAHFLNWFRFLTGSVALALLVTFLGEWHIPPKVFWYYLLGIVLPAEVLLAFLYVRAFQYSPQSLVGPLFSFSTVLLVPIAYIFLGELPTLIGFLGIGSVLAGSLILGWDIHHPGVIRALSNIIKEKGSYFMIGAVIVASVSIVSTKALFYYATPFLSAFYITALLTLVYSPAIFLYPFSRMYGRWPDFVGLLTASVFERIFNYIGLSLLLAVNFISIKRLSAMFDVLFGRIFLHEDHTVERMFGALFMIAGVILILFS